MPGVNDGKPRTRPLRYGDAVKKDQLLAVVWSKEIGEKKSELVDAISKLRLDRDVMNRLEKLEKGVVSERVVREAERNLEADLIAVSRAERTLRSWHLTEEEIAQVRREAEHVEVRQLKSDVDTARKWAQMELRAPFDGVLLDMKAAIGEIVDSTDELAKVADLRTLSVIAHIYEDDLPLVERLTPEQRKWTVTMNGASEQTTLQGEFGLIGEVIDPMQHTASVIGWVPNEDRKLRIGQFITATIPLPADPREVSIPAGALLEDGTNQYVYVATDKTKGIVARRSVNVTRRDSDEVCVRISNAGDRSGAGLKPGEEVVSAGVVELNAGLADLIVKSRNAPPSTSSLPGHNTPVPAD
ncbi:MAG: efflux RND transporter periplasmic adaptor subunit [Planctomycetales bacterium]